VSIHLAPLVEVQRYCGIQALACYSGRTRTIYAPGQAPDPQTSAEGALAHEYGHHVAASRSNPPFASIDYGTKRWASYENVCSKTAAGVLYPGAEDAARYSLNPGEAFARVVPAAERAEARARAGGVEHRDADPLPRRDRVGPARAGRRHTVDGGRADHADRGPDVQDPHRTFTVKTPYDGTISVTPSQAGKASVSVSLLGAKNATVGTSAFKRASGSSISSTVCGQRSYRVRATLAGTVTKKTKTTVLLTVSSS
jgi:hypothetical protein